MTIIWTTIEHIVFQIRVNLNLLTHFLNLFQSLSQSFYHVFNLFGGPSHSFVTNKVGISACTTVGPKRKLIDDYG